MSKGNFVAGLAVGAALGILFAPKKGSELRKDFVNGAKNYSNLKKFLFFCAIFLLTKTAACGIMVNSARDYGSRPDAPIKKSLTEVRPF